MMERQTQQLVRLIDDLLDLSRITRGKLQPRTCRVALADVIRSAVEAVRPAIDEAGHELVVGLSREPIFLEANPTRLAQVVSYRRARRAVTNRALAKPPRETLRVARGGGIGR